MTKYNKFYKGNLTRNLTVRVSEEEYSVINYLKAVTGKSVSDIMRTALNEYVNGDD